MKKMKEMKVLLVAAALLSACAYCRADSANATGNDNDPLKHPVNAYNNREVKEDMADSQQYSQKAKESKAAYKQAKADYEKSLKANGAESDVTKSAKKRMNDAYQDMEKYSRKTREENAELKKDEINAHK